ncbi:MetQ/NlpA family ABC transporter substrate-binding protein [Psittacicella hinzii]|uniref:Lipoprotein n=1 Tax=Psittacicella hinzii TaxID=2028575 RepID=A0A3A1YHJ8_9GAMM|nr:MetQ/NlpA family ABC transporter substrate-binding protein [Psittacicella hinzii]RIY36719.1 methionine ABC transporter substrate-binding protein [Psittacicella hinzii]
MKNVKLLSKALALAGLFSVASTAFANQTLSVAASVTPHAEVIKLVKDDLKKLGVELKVVEFSDYVQPNVVVAEKYVDINFYQHLPYLYNFNRERGYDLVPAFPIFITPIGVYSKKYKSLSEVKNGDVVAIPNDPTNGARALLILQSAGLIKLKDPNNINATPRDIAENPKKLKFKEIEAPNLPRVLNSVDLDVINTNYALPAGLSPQKDAIAIEPADSPYANWVVTRPDNANAETVAKLKQVLYTKKVYDWILTKYNGAVVPAFCPLDVKVPDCKQAKLLPPPAAKK